MEQEILQIAATQGIWATLAVALIFYILKSQEKRDVKQENREAKYQDIITNLTKQLNITQDMKEDISTIKTHILKE